MTDSAVLGLSERLSVATVGDEAPGFGVYVHWPYCLAKCPYCDFNSHVRHGGFDEPRYLRALLAELDHMATRIGSREVASVFFGGGTPSLMSPGAIATILDVIALKWAMAPDLEVTLEANPTSVEAENFTGYRFAGVTRVSLGVQALSDRDLKALGRLHDVQEALAAVELAQSLFERVSFDLIYARPGQTVARWRQELASALRYQAGHMSLYQLTIEPGTPFAALHAAGKLKTPGANRARALYEATQEMMDAAGMPAYEVSNHARPGEACRHNLIYWRGCEWVGIGPGAHSRLNVDGTRRALATLPSPEGWQRQVEAHGHGIAADTALSPAEQADELLLMGLRLGEGVDLERLEALGWMPARERLAALTHEDLVVLEGTRLKATPRGRLVLNALVAELTR